jgi:putative tryptophan/tyrosine transport system substrate-binding protein
METRHTSRLPVHFTWVVLLAAIIAWASSPVAAESLTIVFRDDISIHQQLAKKLKKSIQKKDSTSVVNLFPISKDWSPGTQKTLLKENPEKFLAVGDVALSFCVETAPDVPGIYLMLATEQLVKKISSSWQWEGTKVWVEPEIQLELIRKLMPDIKTVGMVLSPTCKNCGERFVAAATRYGLKLQFILTEERRQIIPAMRKVFGQSDVYLLLPDPNLLNNVTIQELLRLQREFQRPFIGPAMPFVHMGAMMSINYELDKLVQYVAENIGGNNDFMGDRKKISDCCIEVTINQKVMEQLDIKLKTEGLKNEINIITPGVEN